MFQISAWSGWFSWGNLILAVDLFSQVRFTSLRNCSISVELPSGFISRACQKGLSKTSLQTSQSLAGDGGSQVQSQSRLSREPLTQKTKQTSKDAAMFGEIN